MQSHSGHHQNKIGAFLNFGFLPYNTLFFDRLHEKSYEEPRGKYIYSKAETIPGQPFEN